MGSRWPQRTWIAEAAPELKDREILRLLVQNGGREAALLMTSDRMLELVARNREELAGCGYRFQVPALELVQMLNDKVTETEHLASLGVPVPKTVYPLPPQPADLERELGSEVIFKPRTYAEAAIINRKNVIAKGREQIEAVYRKHREWLPLLIGQEIIPGEDGAGWVVSGSFGPRSEMLACAMKRKVRMYPPHFGVSSIAVSEWNPDLAELTARLGLMLGHVGHANFEYRHDYRDGSYKYIEMNPRIQGNVEFDDDTGVPTAWITYLVALGAAVEPWTEPQRDGEYFMDALNDWLGRLHDGESAWSIGRHYLSLRSAPWHGQYFRWSDPLPALSHVRRFMAGRVESAARRMSASADARTAVLSEGRRA
ncbi:MAG: hypothetical protein JSU00_26285 [Acidobacteria bacterium]|nr:hypothetical protein [Acidobacteriota bacterium]